MNPLASASDLVSNSYDAAAVEGALAWATSVISSYCNRNFDLVTGDVVVLSPYRGSVLLPNFPVVDVTSVEAYIPSDAGMSWVALEDYSWVASTGLLFDTSGLPGTHVGVSSFTWPWLPGSLRVTYDHGYASVPTDIRDVCVRIATQYLENPVMMVQRSVGDMSARFSGAAGPVIGAMDRSILDRYAHVGVS